MVGLSLLGSKYLELNKKAIKLCLILLSHRLFSPYAAALNLFLMESIGMRKPSRFCGLWRTS
jgi:hypothetical protein